VHGKHGVAGSNPAPGLVLVWVASYPRSGNTFLTITLRDAFAVAERGTVFEESLGLARLESLRPAPYRLPPELRGLGNDELLEALRERPEPFFIKTHRVRDAAEPSRAIHVVRDGRDALVSYAHFVVEHEHDPRFEGRSLTERLRMLIAEDHNLFGHWSRSVEAWRERSAPTALVRFEELIENPAGTVRSACGRIGIELTQTERESQPFAKLHARDPRMFRRGEIGAWRSEMPAAVEERFWQLHGPQMEALGYPR
jgi:hypothetical protein